MKTELYKQQAEAFLDYANKTPGKDLLFLFNEWAFSKGISFSDRQYIWKVVRRQDPVAPIIISECSEEFVRIDMVLKIIHEADLRQLEKLLDKKVRRQVVHNIA